MVKIYRHHFHLLIVSLILTSISGCAGRQCSTIPLCNYGGQLKETMDELMMSSTKPLGPKRDHYA